MRKQAWHLCCSLLSLAVLMAGTGAGAAGGEVHASLHPDAHFGAQPRIGPAPLTVQFTDHSLNSPTEWAWSFGDGGTSHLQNPTHTYEAPGSYKVIFSASNADGWDSVTEDDCITVTQPGAPVADFVVSPTSGEAPLAVGFEDASTGSPTFWLWSFGDGESYEGYPWASHTYWHPGTYTVALTVGNSDGYDVMTKVDGITVTWSGGETLVPIWSPPFYRPRAAALNPSDGSFWIADGAVTRYSANAQVASVPAPIPAVSLSANQADGSCWVADRLDHKVVHLAASGAVLLERAGIGAPLSVSVDAGDGSCWVVEGMTGQVVHLAADGETRWRGALAGGLEAVAVGANAADGSCWVAAAGGILLHLDRDGTELWRGGTFPGVTQLSVNPSDGSCWIVCRGSSDTAHGWVVHLSATAEVVWTSADTPGSVHDARAVAVDPRDGSCWVAEKEGAVTHLSAEGDLLAVTLVPGGHTLIVANPTDHSAWAFGRGPAAHVAADGALLWHGGAFFLPRGVSVDQSDGSCWVVDAGHRQVVHLSAEGDQLWRGGVFEDPTVISADSGDGSCWVGDWAGHGLVHLAADGTELARVEGVTTVRAVSANLQDHSCWAADWGSGLLLHVSAEGAGLLQTSDYGTPWEVAVNPSDGSCWVATADWLLHLSADGTELWRSLPGEFTNSSVDIDPRDGSCWAWASGAMVHLSESGEELGVAPGAGGLDTCVSPIDGTLWGTAYYSGAITHAAADGTLLSSTATPHMSPYGIAVSPTDGTVWVSAFEPAEGIPSTLLHYVVKTGCYADFSAAPRAGAVPLSVQFRDASQGGPTSWDWDFGDGTTSTEQHPSHTYLAPGRYTVTLRVTGEGGSDTTARPNCVMATFTDLPADSWAFTAALDCLLGGIVAGYPDGGYRPDETVTRGQMAVYIARSLAGGDGGVQVPTGTAEPTFSDVGEDYWAYRHIEYCAGAGVVQGYPDGSYHPDETVNRGQMAVYIARAMVSPTGDAAVPDPPTEPTFSDVTADNEWGWCYRHVEYCAAEGVVQGYWDGSYRPEAVVTRDQMAVYVQRAFQLAL
jgi:PKD repeat protein